MWRWRPQQLPWLRPLAVLLLAALHHLPRGRPRRQRLREAAQLDQDQRRLTGPLRLVIFSAKLFVVGNIISFQEGRGQTVHIGSSSADFKWVGTSKDSESCSQATTAERLAEKHAEEFNCTQFGGTICGKIPPCFKFSAAPRVHKLPKDLSYKGAFRSCGDREDLRDICRWRRRGGGPKEPLEEQSIVNWRRSSFLVQNILIEASSCCEQTG